MDDNDFIIAPPAGWHGSEANSVDGVQHDLLADVLKLWAELHTKENPTPEWFSNWCSRVPSIGCACQDWLRAYLISHPPRFNDWFRWTWGLHNAVNAKLSKPQFLFTDCQACWLGVAPNTKPRLIVTVATGPQFFALLQKTRPLMEAYAVKCNADFLAITNKQFDQWQREKFRVYDLAKQYDETLFLDSDCVVRPETEDIFEVCKGYDVGMHDDLAGLPAQWDWASEYANVLRSQNLGPKLTQNLWNSGVVYCTKAGAEIWKPPMLPLPDSHCSEQFYVQHQADSGFCVMPLPSDLNWQYWFKDFASGVSKAQIIHLANCPDKVSHVDQYL